MYTNADLWQLGCEYVHCSASAWSGCRLIRGTVMQSSYFSCLTRVLWICLWVPDAPPDDVQACLYIEMWTCIAWLEVHT